MKFTRLDTARVTGYVQSGTFTFVMSPALSLMDRKAVLVTSTKNW